LGEYGNIENQISVQHWLQLLKRICQICLPKQLCVVHVCQMMNLVGGGKWATTKQFGPNLAETQIVGLAIFTAEIVPKLQYFAESLIILICLNA
jgi:hypothetical protein